jgi:hypothetical protein
VLTRLHLSPPAQADTWLPGTCRHGQRRRIFSSKGMRTNRRHTQKFDITTTLICSSPSPNTFWCYRQERVYFEMRLAVASTITGSHVTTGPFGTPNHAPAESTAVNVGQRMTNRAWPPANRRKYPGALLEDRRCASPVTRSEHITFGLGWFCLPPTKALRHGEPANFLVNTIRHTAKRLEVCSL